MNIYDTMRARMNPSWDKFTRLSTSAKIAINVAETVTTAAAEVGKDAKLSPIGRVDAVRKAAKEAAAKLRDAEARAAAELADLRADHAKLTQMPADKADLARAVLRMEIRQWLRAMPAGERIVTLTGENADPAILDAALSGPPALAGLTPETVDTVRARYIEKVHPAEAGNLSGGLEASEFATSAIAIAKADLQRAVAFDRPDEFARWYEAA